MFTLRGSKLSTPRLISELNNVQHMPTHHRPRPFLIFHLPSFASSQYLLKMVRCPLLHPHPHCYPPFNMPLPLSLPFSTSLSMTCRCFSSLRIRHSGRQLKYSGSHAAPNCVPSSTAPTSIVTVLAHIWLGIPHFIHFHNNCIFSV